MKQEPIPLPALKQAVAEELARHQNRCYSRPTATARYLGISLATLWRWAKERPDFPKPRKHGPRCTVWDLTELDAWLDAQQKQG